MLAAKPLLINIPCTHSSLSFIHSFVINSISLSQNSLLSQSSIPFLINRLLSQSSFPFLINNLLSENSQFETCERELRLQQIVDLWVVHKDTPIILGSYIFPASRLPNPNTKRKHFFPIASNTKANRSINKMHQNYTSSPHATQNSTKRKSIPEVVNERKKKKTVSHSHQGQSSKSICGICFDTITKSNKFRNNRKCDHLFCNNCISKHVSTQINKNNVKVNCPIPECSVELKLKHLKSILPNEVITRWETALCESSIDWREKSYCPFKNCSVLLVNDGGEIVTSSECPSCHRLFCAQCKVPWHGEMSCREFQKMKKKMKKRKHEKDLDLKFFELAKRKMWQNCPKCSFYVNRTSGCEHIICRCGCSFCYNCGKDWKYGHICNISRHT